MQSEGSGEILLAVFLYLRWPTKKAGKRLLTRAGSDRTGRNGFQRKKGRLSLSIRKKLFTAGGW